MTFSTAMMGVFGLFGVSSVVYVYLFRGSIRYSSFAEYLRKGWPITTPLNCFLYLFTKKKASQSILNPKDFPELQAIKEQWHLISQEAQFLKQAGFFEQVKNKKNDSYYDIGFRTFYKYGWSKFYLHWYGYQHESAKRYCPKTVEVLSKIPTVNGAMFSLLPAGAKLTRHLDPLACSLRYHLGLSTPNQDSCSLNVDGMSYSWRDGEAFMFDETFLHFATNSSDQDRLILMCDIDRPLSFLGRGLNALLKFLLKFSVVPNTKEDKRGLFNRLFSASVPLLENVRKLKQTNMILYKMIKYSFNFFALLLILVVFYFFFTLVESSF